MRRALRRLWYLVRRDRLESDLAEEMAFHRALAERDASPAAASQADARVAATRTFGSAALAANRARDVWIAPWLQDLAQDLRFGVRLIRKEPGFTAAVVLVLGVGIGVNTTQFTVVDATCIRGLPIERPDRVLFIRTRDGQDRKRAMSFLDFRDLRSAAPAFTGAAAYEAAPVVVADDTQAPGRVTGVRQSAVTFALLRVRPSLGRDFVDGDDVPGAPEVALISAALWSDRYGGDPQIVGRRIRIDGTPATVVGVMPAGFAWPSNADVWRPLAAAPGLLTQSRDARAYGVLARMTDAASLAEARAEVAAVGDRLRRDYPDSNRDVRFEALPINDAVNGNIHDPAWQAFITVGCLILLLASANAANLLLMRAVERTHEIAVRASLGASRFRIVRQLLVESALLATLGGLLGLALARLGVRLFASAIPPGTMPYFMTYTVDARVLTVLVAGSAATVLVFGLAPAIHLSRRAGGSALRTGPRAGSASRGAARWMTGFLTAEFALAIVLLALVAVAVAGALNEKRGETAVDPDGRLTASLTLPSAKYPTADRRVAFYRDLIARAGRAEGVEAAALTTALPIGGARPEAVVVEGRSDTRNAPPAAVDTIAVSPRYFDALGVPLRRGRPLENPDGDPGHESVVVNQRFVDVYLPNGDPLGRRIRATDESTGATRTFGIVGVAPDVRQRAQGVRVDPVVYLPLAAVAPSSVVMIVRTHGNAAGLAPQLRTTVANLDGDLPLYRVRPLEEALRDASWNPRLSNELLLTLAAIALGLSVVGLHAVTTHGVASRLREIGIRIALGARGRDVIRLVVARAARQVAYGFAAGIVCTLVWSRIFYEGAARGEAYRPVGPVVWSAVAGLLAIVTVLVSLAPARRAAHVDPAVTLRSE